MKAVGSFREVQEEKINIYMDRLHNELQGFARDESMNREHLAPLLPADGVNMETFTSLQQVFMRDYMNLIDRVRAFWNREGSEEIEAATQRLDELLHDAAQTPTELRHELAQMRESAALAEQQMQDLQQTATLAE